VSRGTVGRAGDDEDLGGHLQAQEVVITLVGEYVLPGERIWAGSMVKLLCDLGFTEAAARTALGRVVSRGLLERAKQGRQVFYSATSRLVQLLTEGHRQTFWFRYGEQHWNGCWTVVWYAIPEGRLLARRRLGRRLGFLGFGALQDGIRVAPGDREREVREIISGLGVGSHAVVLAGALPSWIDRSDVFARGWDLDALQQRYTAFVERFAHLRGARAVTSLTAGEAFVLRAHVLEAFRQIAPMDPKVAESILRVPGVRRAAIECFDQVESMLRPRALQYFRAASTPNS
jgi:phenylacetic acid degradation operon negative regulatory protein